MNVSFSSTFAVTSVVDVQKDWGDVANLRGLVSSLTIFGDSLSASNVKTLYKKGVGTGDAVVWEWVMM